MLNYNDEKSFIKFNYLNEFAHARIDKVTPMIFGHPNDKMQAHIDCNQHSFYFIKACNDKCLKKVIQFGIYTY